MKAALNKMTLDRVSAKACASTADRCAAVRCVLRPVVSVLSLSVAAAMMMALPAYAADPAPHVDAGLLNRQLQQQTPNIPNPTDPNLLLPDEHGDQPAKQSDADSHATVTIKKVVFEGVDDSLVSTDELQKAIADHLNRPLTFAQLREVVNAVTALCRLNDMPLAQAVLPPQTINKDGVLRIQVVAGHYDNSIITNSSVMHDSVARNIISTWAKPGHVIQRSKLQHAALLLSEIPGVHTQVLLEPGRLPGTSAANVHITPASRLISYLSMDNLGDPTTGRARLIAGAYVNQLLGFGDQLQFTVLDAIEKSGITNASVDYSALINGYGTRAGANYSYLYYHYTLNDTSFNGYSHNWNLYVSQPWLRRPGARLDMRLDGGQQFIHDSVSVSGDRRVSMGGLSLQGSLASVPGGISAFSLRGSVGNVNGVERIDRDSNRFLRFNYYLSHQQHIWQPISLFASVKGQLTSQNLDTSQKFIFGGADGVRAYDIGNGVADIGTILTVELRNRWSLPFSVAGGQPELTLAGFYDQGWGQQYRHNQSATGGPLSNNNFFTLSGAGLYLSVAQSGNYSVTLTWAHRTGAPDPISNYRGRNRVWISAIKTF